jgi:hypothetical protein
VNQFDLVEDLDVEFFLLFFFLKSEFFFFPTGDIAAGVVEVNGVLNVLVVALLLFFELFDLIFKLNLLLVLSNEVLLQHFGTCFEVWKNEQHVPHGQEGPSENS